MSETKDSLASVGPQSHDKEAIHMEDVGPEYPTRRMHDDQESADLGAYWKSYRLLGSLLAIVLLGNNLFIGYSMPVTHAHVRWRDQER